MESTRSSEGDLTPARYRDLHRPRSSNAPRKRTRFAPARPTPSTNASNNLAQSNSIRPNPTPNGRPLAANGAPRLRSTPLPMSQPLHDTTNLVTAPPTVYDRLARAQRASELRTRPDPRFVSGHRPLESMSALKSSIAVSLFDNGFVRHDHVLAHAMGANLSGGHEILALCRYPYGPGSRAFLEALQSGVLPDEQELPEPSRRTYYDGCLIAEVFDYRGVCDEAIDASGAAWRKRAWFQRVLLRPDMCSHVFDVQELTAAVEKREQYLAFESRLLTTKHPTLDLEPTPRLQSAVDITLTKSPAFAPQAGASVAGKKRRRERAGDVPPRPPVSMSALLLIDAADKNQTRTLMLKAQEAAPKPATPSQSNTQLPDFLGDAGEKTVKLAAPALDFSQKSRARGIPPTQLFKKPNDPPQQSASHNTGSKNHERLRTIRLLLADRNASHVIRNVRNAQQNGTATPQQVQAMQKTLSELNRKGQQVCVLELVSRPARGCDVALFRGFIGDKARDVNKIELATVEEAHNFLDQFKKILDREGYICIHDGDPQKAQSQAAHHASVMDARRRAMAVAAANGQMPMQAAAAAVAAAGLSPAQRIQAQQQAAVAQAHARNAAQLHNHQAAALRRAGLVQAQQFQHQQRQAFASTMTQQQLAVAAAAKQAQFANMLPMSPGSALRAQPQPTPQGVPPIALTQNDVMRARQVQHAQMIEQQARLRAQSSEPIPANAIGLNAIPPSMLSLAPTGNPSVASAAAAAAAANAAATGDTASQRSRGSGSRGSRKR